MCNICQVSHTIIIWHDPGHINALIPDTSYFPVA